MSVSERTIRISLAPRPEDVNLSKMSRLLMAKRLTCVVADKAIKGIITILFHGGNFDHMILTNTPSQAHLAVVDGVLLTVAGWVRELERAVVPCGEGMTHIIPVEYLRRSRLGQDLLLVVRYIEDERASPADTISQPNVEH
jgi:hypothetical protein